MANLTTIANVLKTAYLPAFRNQINTDPSPFMEKIHKAPLTASTITASAPVGLNGGVAWGGDDASATPAAGAQNYTKFTLPSKNLYVNIEISDKTVKLGSTDKSAMLNAFDAEVRGSYMAAEKNIGRALFGDGDGILCDISAAVSSAATFSSNNVSKVFEGMTVDVYVNKSSGGDTPTYSSPTYTDTPAVATARVVSVDRANKTVTLESTKTFSTTGALTSAGKTASGTYGFITLQKSYGNEICGLGAVMNSGITTLYDVTKSTNAWINPITIACSNSVTDTLLYEGVSQALDFKNTKIDMILAGTKAFQQYQYYMRTNAGNRIVVDKTMKFHGGAVGYILNVGSQEVVLVHERNVPSTEMWGVCTDDWTYYATPLDFADEAGASPFTLVDGHSYYRALLTQYGNLLCKNPGGCVKFTGCAS